LKKRKKMPKHLYELTSQAADIARELAKQRSGIIDNPDVAEELARELLKNGHEPDDKVFFRMDVDRRGKEKKVFYSIKDIQVCEAQGIRYLP
jgi:hypothetical protein